jgi:very-short-patch-repair endonuclease
MGKRGMDLSAVNERLLDAIQHDFQLICMDVTGQLNELDVFESEIELLVATSICMACRIVGLSFVIADNDDYKTADQNVVLVPQYKWDRYRIDLFVAVPQLNKAVFVECDGHEFHERTKEQAEHDRSKDRAIQAAGMPILRFTGREIWRDSMAVTIEIMKFVGAFKIVNGPHQNN